MRKTKIVCTIGPSSESLENTKKLIMAGMNVARLNFSHGDFDEHGGRIKAIRQACEELNKTVAILLDTKGPEIRTGKLEVEPIELVQDEYITLTTEEILGTKDRLSITYADLPNDVEAGSTILIDDGLIGLTVVEVQGTEIKCRIVNGGTIKSKKGVNVPGVAISCQVSLKKTLTISFLVLSKVSISSRLLSYVKQATCLKFVNCLKNITQVIFKSSPKSKTSKVWTTWMKSLKCLTV